MNCFLQRRVPYGVPGLGLALQRGATQCKDDIFRYGKLA